ncbi:MAG TPA: ATP-binding protein [Terriglobales bacterium]|nr:ATP-binding protein [Terriglobales bacterium]
MNVRLPKVSLGFLRPSSVRGRLTLQYTVIFSLTLVVAAALLYGVLTWIIYWNIDSELQDEANYVKQYIQFAPTGQPTLVANGAAGSDDLNAIFRLAQISDASGRLVKQSPELKGLGFSLEPSELKRILVERPTFITHGWPRQEEIRFANAVLRGPGNQPYLLQIGARLKPINDALDTFLWVMLMLLPVTVASSAVAGSIMAQRTLKPVADITHAAQKITASNLSQRIPVVAAGDELAELAQTCNEMIARLEASFQQMNEFAANVSHELRTPLQAIQGETELALISEAPLAECRRVLESNLEEIDRLNRMIRNLLVLAQADAGQVRPRLEALDLNELVRDLVEQMQVVAAAREVALRAVTAAPVPVQADSLRLRQMVLNLIDNALKYTPPGGRIEVRVERQLGRARVQVRDTGIGIDPADLPHIFERFYRADKSRSRTAGAVDGCGLGLPMVKWVAELHRGSVEVTSTPGQGSSFTVNLPMAGVA